MNINIYFIILKILYLF